MAKTDFKPFMIRDVVFAFPRLGTTYKFNTAEKRSEECNPRAQGAAYSIGWTMSEADSKKLYTELKAHYESCVTKAPFGKVFGMKRNEDGTVINGLKQPLADVHIWGGSSGNLKVTAYPVTDPNGVGGVSLLIDTVQVVDAVYGGGGLDDFDTIAPVGQIQDPDNFGAASSAADPFANIPKTAANDDLSMDEIPF
jgi:hypothetical protein